MLRIMVTMGGALLEECHRYLVGDWCSVIEVNCNLNGKITGKYD